VLAGVGPSVAFQRVETLLGAPGVLAGERHDVDEMSATVTAVAADLGYSTTSALVHMFRTNMDMTPGAYVLEREHRPIR
jgi:AraC-like DNA-binding protein